MFLPVATFISEKYTYEDYIKLKFELNSSEEVWEKAIDIFIDRINSRFFYAIDKLIENKDRYEMLKYGFAIMTLQCSLIDTLKSGNKEFISVDIFIMDKKLREYFKEYIKELRNKDEYLRKNFIKIMNHVCKI